MWKSLKQHEFCNELLTTDVKPGKNMFCIYLHNNVVDRDMDQFHKEANKSHYCKAYCCCHCNLLEFFPVRFSASFNQSYGVFNKLTAGFHELHYLIHDCQLLRQKKPRRTTAERSDDDATSVTYNIAWSCNTSGTDTAVGWVGVLSIYKAN